MRALVVFLDKKETLKLCQSCENIGELAIFSSKEKKKPLWDSGSGTLPVGLQTPEL